MRDGRSVARSVATTAAAHKAHKNSTHEVYVSGPLVVTIRCSFQAMSQYIFQLFAPAFCLIINFDSFHFELAIGDTGG